MASHYTDTRKMLPCMPTCCRRNMSSRHGQYLGRHRFWTCRRRVGQYVGNMSGRHTRVCQSELFYDIQKSDISCRSPDSWAWTDQSQISLPHSPTPPKCSKRAILVLMNNLGIVYHQCCSSSCLDLSISAPIPARFTAPGNGNQVQT